MLLAPSCALAHLSDVGLLRRLADYCIKAHYQYIEALPLDDEDDDNLRLAPRYREFVFEVARRTARLSATWQCLGAVHGMLNTDNMSIIGVTLDHGQFAFMEHTDLDFVSSSADREGRYSFRNQNAMLRWGCERLADALLPLHCTRPADMTAELTVIYDDEFDHAYDRGMQDKLGLKFPEPALISDLLALMHKTGADWTCTFQAFGKDDCPQALAIEIGKWCLHEATQEWESWLSHYADVLSADEDYKCSPGRKQTMAGANPFVTPRRWLLEHAANAAENCDDIEVRRILGIVTAPFTVPSDLSYCRPPAPLDLCKPVDPSMLGPMGPKAVQALEDADYWRCLCPELNVASPTSSKLVHAGGFEVSDEEATRLRGAMDREGFFTLADLPWAVDIAAVARGIEALHQAGWPPLFILAYDEPWIMAAQLSSITQQLFGHKVAFDWAAFHVPGGQAGTAPHRDLIPRPFSADPFFHADNMPRYISIWVAMVDVPATSSCLMCVPRPFDAGYLPTGSSAVSPIRDASFLVDVRPLPLNAGAMVLFSHRLYHWSRSGDTVDSNGVPAKPRIALAMVAADPSFKLDPSSSCLASNLLPLPPLKIRVALAAGQTFNYLATVAGERARVAVSGSQSELFFRCFSACSEHFTKCYTSKVFDARLSISKAD